MELQPITAKTLSYSFITLSDLNTAYMRFIKGGALFIKGNVNASLGEVIELTIHLPNTNEMITLHTQVVWITPPNAQDGKPAGIGLQFFSTSDRKLKKLLNYK
jgi:type IV pilus assembly protein PilZ